MADESPSQADLLAEAYRRGVMPPDMKAHYEEAIERGLVSKPPSKFSVHMKTQNAPTVPQTKDEAIANLSADKFAAPLTVGNAAKAAGNVAVGVTGAVLGIPGDIESLVRWSSRKGNSVSQGTVLPTTSQVENFIAGEPQIREAAIERGVGNFIGPMAFGRVATAGNALRRVATGSKIPDDVAGAQYVQDVLAKSGKTPNNVLGAVSQNKPFTLAEAAGSNAQTNLLALARREGKTGDALNAQMLSRSARRPDRVLDDMLATSGIEPSAAKGDIDALVSKGRQSVSGMFEKALSSDKGVWNSDLERLAQRPVIQKAMSQAYDDLLNADINPEGMGFTGRDPQTGKFAQMPRPSAKAWDLIRKRVSSQVERDGVGRIIPDNQSPGNYNVNRAGHDLTDALRKAVPGYGDALDKSGEYLKSKAAFELGQNAILNDRISTADFKKAVDAMTPAEKKALKGGVANKLFQQSQGGKLRPQQFITPNAADKLETALGQDGATNFVAGLHDESRMKAFEQRARTSAGSQTTPLAQAMKDQDAFNSSPEMDDLVNSIKDHGVKRGVLNWLGQKATEAGHAGLDKLRTRGLSTGARDEAGRILMMPPSEGLNALVRATPPQNGLSLVSNAPLPGVQNQLAKGIFRAAHVNGLRALVLRGAQEAPQ